MADTKAQIESHSQSIVWQIAELKKLGDEYGEALARLLKKVDDELDDFRWMATDD